MSECLVLLTRNSYYAHLIRPLGSNPGVGAIKQILRKKIHDLYLFPLIFEIITDFPVSIADKQIRIPSFFLQDSDADGSMKHSHAQLQKNIIKSILPFTFKGM